MNLREMYFWNTENDDEQKSNNDFNIYLPFFFLFRYSFSIILFRKIIYIYSKQNFNTKTSYYSFISNRNLTLNVKKFLLPRSQNYDISRDQSTFFQQGEKELYKGIMKFISVSKLVLKY